MKSYALTLNLRDDPVVIDEYVRYHAAVWPEVEAGLKSVGVTSMKIYLLGRRLFMYMEAVDSFEPLRDFQRYMNSKRAQEWDALMRTFQEKVPEAGPGEWWASMRQVYDLKS
ncbi:MAG: L-rhamnose mutarotase [SAR202 cluster bacterium]|nr:L-rhamnose mutarotase [SAR202 cluster bacterium]